MPDYFGQFDADTHHYHATPKDRYCQIYFEAFELFLTALEIDLTNPIFAFIDLQEVLLKAVRGDSWDHDVEQVIKFYGKDVNRSSLEVQLALLPHAAKSLGFEVKSFTISDLVAFLQKYDDAKKVLLSEVIKVGKLILVVPATNAVSERSFSALKRVKTYLRATTTDTRMNNLLVLHIHKSYTDNIDLIKVANEFLERRDNRKTVFGTFLSKDL